jgi:dynein heavy chain
MVVMVDRDLLAFGGDTAGEALDEICMADISDLKKPLAWGEPILQSGPMSLPTPRKGMAAIYKNGVIYMFSGLASAAGGSEAEPSNEMYAATVRNSTLDIKRIEQQEPWPEARAGANFQHFSDDIVFLFGGLDAAGKPLNDGWLFHIKKCTWSCVYHGHPDLALPAGALCCLQGHSLVAINAASGSPKLDVAGKLDFEAVQAEYAFVHRMKSQSAAQLSELQAWTSKQESGLAHNIDDLSTDFKKLLETMAALYDIREAGFTKELLVEQLRETFLDLANHKVNTKKSLEQLEAVLKQLQEIKKNAPLVKEAVAPVQKTEGKRIRNDIQDYTDKVNAYARAFRKFPFLTFATGPEMAYASIDSEVREPYLPRARHNRVLLCVDERIMWTSDVTSCTQRRMINGGTRKLS